MYYLTLMCDVHKWTFSPLLTFSLFNSFSTPNQQPGVCVCITFWLGYVWLSQGTYICLTFTCAAPKLNMIQVKFSIQSFVGTVSEQQRHQTLFTSQHLIYFWTIAKSSHRDYFELHWMQINICRTIVELRTLTTDTKLFTTLWIVQNHTNTALIIEILAWSPFKDSGCVCVLPPGGGYKNWLYGMMTKTLVWPSWSRM